MKTNNVTDITDRIDNWQSIGAFHDADGNIVSVSGNYRKNAHEIDIMTSGASNHIRLGLMEIAALQKAIKEYEDR